MDDPVERAEKLERQSGKNVTKAMRAAKDQPPVQPSAWDRPQEWSETYARSLEQQLACPNSHDADR